MTEEKLRHYLRLLVKWQQSINLVSPATLDEAWRRHFEDSLQVSELVPEGATVFDFGSGAGFPGMVLAIARPDLAVSLVESDTKKCTFLSTVSRETKSPATIVNRRIESVSRESIPTVITARALASLDKLLEYSLPFAQEYPDLMMLFLKGRKASEELAAARALYGFEAEKIASRTDPEGCILKITNLSVRSGS